MVKNLGVRLALLESKVEILGHRAIEFSEFRAAVKQRRAEERAYIERLRRKSQQMSTRLYNVRKFSGTEYGRLKRIAEKSSYFLMNFRRYPKRYVLYLTRTQGSKLKRLLNDNYRRCK